MSTLGIFNHDGLEIRAGIDEHGDPWIAAADVAQILGYSAAKDMVRSLDPDEKGGRLVPTPGGQQQLTVITEAGFYQALMQRQTGRMTFEHAAVVKKFQRWVTHEVLPSIRRTGSYSVQPPLPRSYADALRELASTVERKEALEAKVADDAPKVEAFDALMDSEGFYSMEAAAKVLGIGRNTMMRLLREDSVLMSTNLPYQRYAHHFKVTPGTRPGSGGREVPTKTTRVRPSGLQFIRVRLNLADAATSTDDSSPMRSPQLQAV